MFAIAMLTAVECICGDIQEGSIFTDVVEVCHSKYDGINIVVGNTIDNYQKHEHHREDGDHYLAEWPPSTRLYMPSIVVT